MPLTCSTRVNDSIAREGTRERAAPSGAYACRGETDFASWLARFGMAGGRDSLCLAEAAGFSGV